MTKDELINQWLKENWEDTHYSELMGCCIAFHRDAEFTGKTLAQVLETITDYDEAWFEDNEIDPATITD
jgi:hypothetical protein